MTGHAVSFVLLHTVLSNVSSCSHHVGLVAALLDSLEAAVAKTYMEHTRGNSCTIQQAVAAAGVAGRSASYRDPFPNIDPFSATTILLYQAVKAGAVNTPGTRLLISTSGCVYVLAPMAAWLSAQPQCYQLRRLSP